MNPDRDMCTQRVSVKRDSGLTMTRPNRETKKRPLKFRVAILLLGLLQIKPDDIRSTSKATNHGSGKRHIRLIAFLFMLLGLLVFAFSSFYFSDPSLKHFVESVGAALFIFGLVSILVEFRDFVQYTSRVLQEQLLERKYIRTLGTGELRNLKRIVDETITGASELGSRGGFYEFVGNHFEMVLKMPYRREMYDISRYSIVPGEPALFLRQTVCKYIFVKGFSGDKPLVVPWGYGCVDIPELQHASPQLRELIVIVDGKKFQSVSAKTDPGKTILVSSDGDAEPITVEWERDEKIRGTVFNHFSWGYEIPGSRNYDPEKEVNVELHETVLCPAKVDDNYFLRLSYPTKNLTVTSVFPDGVSATAHAFALSFPNVQPLVQGGNVSTVVIDGWSLPGHGAYVTWQLPPNWDQLVAATMKGEQPKAN